MRIITRLFWWLWQVKVAFHLSAPLLTNQSQTCPEAPPTVTMLCSERGERKLRFQQSLTIQYSNNSVQVSHTYLRL